jgi:hypothetical protein
MTSSIEVAWKPVIAKQRHALERMWLRRFARVSSLILGMTHPYDNEDPGASSLPNPPGTVPWQRTTDHIR